MKALLALSLLLATAAALPAGKPAFKKIALYPHLRQVGKANFDHRFDSGLSRDMMIHDGVPADDGQFPFIASVVVDLGFAILFCGGSVVSENTIISAGHCVDGWTELVVTTGITHLSEPIVDDWQRQTTRDFAPHEGYTNNGAQLANDISYVRVPVDLPLTDPRVETIAIADVEPAVGDLVTELGWGALDADSSITNDLQYVTDVPIVSDDSMNIFGNQVDKAQFICTWGRSVFGGTCGGDSGGPGVVGGLDGEKHVTGPLFGATSFGTLDCEVGPSCYTSLPYYRDWIRENTGV